MIINRSDCQVYYPFEGNVNDYSGNASNGTVTGTTQYVDSSSGKAFDFDGATYIGTGTNITTTGSFSVLLRGDITAKSSNQRYFDCVASSKGCFFLYNNSSSKWTWRVITTVTGTIDLDIADASIGTDIYAMWLYFDSGNEIGVKVYETDGTYQSFTSSTTDTVYDKSATNIRIGSNLAAAQYFDGQIDDYAVIESLITDEDFYRFYMGMGITDL